MECNYKSINILQYLNNAGSAVSGMQYSLRVYQLIDHIDVSIYIPTIQLQGYVSSQVSFVGNIYQFKLSHLLRRH